MKGVGRRFTDIAQKARGRTPLRYEFELIPYFVGELPAGVTKVLFAWERGTKVFMTEEEPVNANTHAAFWKQYLKQTATMYATGTGSSVEPKDYAFKVQSIKEGGTGESDRKTIGKIHVDLAQFCTGQTDPAPTDIYLQLKPHGKLKISIKASFLKHAKFDDTLTELSGNPSEWASQTGGRGALRGGQHQDGDYDEQDLSGFDHQSDSASMSNYSTHRGGGGGGAQATISEEGGPPEGDEDQAAAERRARRAKRRKNKELSDPSRARLPNEIEGGFELPMDPEELRRIQLEKKQERNERKRKDLEHAAMIAQITAQVKADLLLKEEASGGVTCCCLPRKRKAAQADVEEVSLLSASQAVEMKRSNKL